MGSMQSRDLAVYLCFDLIFKLNEVLDRPHINERPCSLPSLYLQTLSTVSNATVGRSTEPAGTRRKRVSSLSPSSLALQPHQPHRPRWISRSSSSCSFSLPSSSTGSARRSSSNPFVPSAPCLPLSPSPPRLELTHISLFPPFLSILLNNIVLTPTSQSARTQAFKLYVLLTTGGGSTEHRQLKADILKSKRELDQTSSQDEFAKWAKLRRKLDKLIAELEKTSTSTFSFRAQLSPVEMKENGCVGLAPATRAHLPSSSPFATDAGLQTSKATFTSTASRIIWLLTTGTQFALVWWYRKQAVFYLPNGWLGGGWVGLEWWFSLPFAPKGTSRFARRELDMDSQIESDAD